MPQSEAAAWWAEVQHVREAIERRRAGADSPDTGVDRQRGARFIRSTDDRDGDELGGQVPGRRFERSGHANHVPVDPDRARARGRRSEVREHWTGVERRDPSRADRRASGRTEHHDPSRGDRRDPGSVDRRAGGAAGHHASARSEHRESARSEHRESARSEHRESARSERRDLGRGERRDAIRPDRRDPGRVDRGASFRDEPREASHSHSHSHSEPGPRARAERPNAAPHRPADFARPGSPAGDPIAATAAATATASVPLSAPRARRTVQITGRPVTAPRLVEVERRRPVRRPAERIGGRPDRIALWAVLFCFFLILVALSS